jgi:hypothetical protein
VAQKDIRTCIPNSTSFHFSSAPATPPRRSQAHLPLHSEPELRNRKRRGLPSEQRTAGLIVHSVSPCTQQLRTKSPDTMTESVTSEWRNLLVRRSAKTHRRKLNAEPFKSNAGETLVAAQLCKQPRERANRTGLARCFFPFTFCRLQ